MEPMEKDKNSQNEVIQGDLANKRIRHLHEKDLGLHTPNDYFSSSKKELLNRISEEKEKKKVVPLYQNKMAWIVAASVALMISIVLFGPKTLPSVNGIPAVVLDTIQELNDDEGYVEQTLSSEEDDVLVSSLFMEDDEVDAFVNSYVLEEVLFVEVDREETFYKNDLN